MTTDAPITCVPGHVILEDMRERLTKAAQELHDLAKQTSASGKSRLEGKVEGVNLALDYLRAYDA